jgi:transcriptional regulator of arginine metabolism
MKVNRHQKIVELVSKYHIETQEELADRLREEGFQITQATVSRDIRDLKLTKVQTDDGRQKYVILESPKYDMKQKYIRVLKDGFLSVNMAENIIVIKTVPGMAMAVAAALDALEIEGIVGSIAGDDTVMCAVKTTQMTPMAVESIAKLAI